MAVIEAQRGGQPPVRRNHRHRGPQGAEIPTTLTVSSEIVADELADPHRQGIVLRPRRKADVCFHNGEGNKTAARLQAGIW